MNLKSPGARSFLNLWAAQFIAKVGNGLSPFALSIWAYQETRTSGAVAIITLAGFLPALLLAPLAGVLADRFSRKNLMLLGNIGFAVSLALLLAALAQSEISRLAVCLALAVGSIFAALLDPAYRAIVTDLLPPAEYARAAGLVQLASAAQFLISPFLAGLLIAQAGIVRVVQLDLALTAVAVVMMLLVHAPIRQRSELADNWWKNFQGGLSFLHAHPGVMTLLALVTLVTFGMGILQTLLTPLMLDLTSEETVGIVRSVAATGLLIASLVISLRNMGQNHLRSISRSLLLGGVAVIALGITVNVLYIGVFCFIFFATLALLNTSVEVLARSAIPGDIQGTVWGLIGFISQLGYVAAFALSGVLADAFFSPLLTPSGSLAESLFGTLYGVGPSRGIGLLFGLVGLVLVGVGILIPRNQRLRHAQEGFRLSVTSSKEDQ